jgi:hypothetical protein
MFQETFLRQLRLSQQGEHSSALRTSSYHQVAQC